MIYEILTWLITRLSDMRYFYLKKFHRNTGFWLRKEKAVSIEDHRIYMEGLNVVCCDCNLIHFLVIDGNNILHIVPIRPKHYQYKLRSERIRKTQLNHIKKITNEKIDKQKMEKE